MSSPWIDLSVPLTGGMVHWPGDPPTRIGRVLDLARGDPCTLSTIETCVHAGTHIDAPAHFLPGEATVEAMPLALAVGKARVIAIRDARWITPAELRQHRIRPGQRLLFQTANSKRCWKTPSFVEDFVALTPEAALYLAKRRVALAGIDYLSIGGPGPRGAEVHRILLGAGIWIVEGLDLSSLDPGPVDLICLPLKLAGTEGAPARAIARQRPSEPSRKRRPA